MINIAHAAAPASGLQDTLLSIVPLLVIMLFFWLIILRPKMKQQKQLMSSLNMGDEVLMHSGIYGKIVKITDQDLVVRIAKETEIKIQKQAVASKVNPTTNTKVDA